ncbi:MAG: tetratricopeptide repeat protein [Candidatus Brocadiae bacterium]|nr:tetratricopeptide repeat protein [Candidatus Brocadiia bacterium]
MLSHFFSDSPDNKEQQTFWVFTPKFLSIFLTFYLAFFLLLSAYSFLNSPVTLTDTDLWYHLNGGKYLWEKGELPETSFFSFLNPVRERPDYFWLFRTLVYKCYEWGNYHGLVILRGITFLLFGLLFLGFILKDLKNQEIRLFAILLGVVCLVLFSGRWVTIRPHFFSYLSLCIAISILDKPSPKVMLLPLVGILWVNFHGITYPVLLLVCLAYTLEMLVHARKKACFQKEDKLFLFSVLITVLFVLFGTPHGLKLLPIPFISIEYAKDYILELKPTVASDFLPLQFSLFVPNVNTLRNMFFFFILGIFVRNLLFKQVRISHCILFLASLYLISECNRFFLELILLTLPSIKVALLSWDKSFHFQQGFGKAFCYTIVCALLFALPWQSIYRPLSQERRFPFCDRDLPAGVVSFLKHIKVGGNILHHPNYGGYLQWELYPDYKIVMDMQIPHLFGDEDLFLVKNCMQDKGVFQKFTSVYDISFLMIEIEDGVPECLQNNEDYKIVFMDDVHVLYANQKKHPAVVSEYAIHSFNPYKANDMSISDLKKEERQYLLEELLRISKIYPYSRYINQLIAMIYNKEKKYEKAQQYADLVILAYPQNPKGYRLKGDSFMLRLLPQEAIRYYQKALVHSDEKKLKSEVYTKLGSAYLETAQYQEAYNSFAKAQKIFSQKPDFKYLIGFAMAAQGIGNNQKALWLYLLADIQTPDEEKIWKEKIQEQIFLLQRK